MSEPTAKKLKTSEKQDDVTFVNMAGDKEYDRVLCVENTKIAVDSEKLIENSEYFRAMFTSDFAEKNKKEIKLNNVTLEQLRTLLTAIISPEKLEITEDNLRDLSRIFLFFQAAKCFSNLLKVNEMSEKIAAKKKFALTEEFPDLKEHLEKLFVEKFLDKFPANRIFDESEGNTPECDAFTIECLELVSEYSVPKLKEVVNAELICQYKKSDREIIADDKFAALVKKFQLPELKKIIEENDIAELRKHLDNDIRQYTRVYDNEKKREILLQRAVDFSSQNLKNVVEQTYIEQFNDRMTRPVIRACGLTPVYGYLKDLLIVSKKFGLEKYKDCVDTGLTNKFWATSFFSHFAWLLIKYELPKLQAALCEYYSDLDNKIEDYDLKRIWSFSVHVEEDEDEEDVEEDEEDVEEDEEDDEHQHEEKRSFGSLAEVLSKRFIAQFNEDKKFKYVKFAFVDGMEEFKGCIVDFLKTVAPKDKVMRYAKRFYISKLSAEEQEFIEQCLKKPDA